MVSKRYLDPFKNFNKKHLKVYTTCGCSHKNFIDILLELSYIYNNVKTEYDYHLLVACDYIDEYYMIKKKYKIKRKRKTIYGYNFKSNHHMTRTAMLVKYKINNKYFIKYIDHLLHYIINNRCLNNDILFIVYKIHKLCELYIKGCEQNNLCDLFMFNCFKCNSLCTILRTRSTDTVIQNILDNNIKIDHYNQLVFEPVGWVDLAEISDLY